MRTLALAATLVVTAAPAQDTKKEPEARKEEAVKYTLDRLDKSWGLEVEGLAVRDTLSPKFVGGRESKQYPVTELRVTLAFTKDGDPKPVERAFVPFSTLHMTPVPSRPTHVLFYLFDEENVALQKVYLERLDGEVTGKAGDAFRAILHCDPDTYKKVKKIDLRPSEPAK